MASNSSALGYGNSKENPIWPENWMTGPLGYYNGKSKLTPKAKKLHLVRKLFALASGQEGGQIKKNKEGTAFSWFSSSDEKWMTWLPAGKRLLY